MGKVALQAPFFSISTALLMPDAEEPAEQGDVYAGPAVAQLGVIPMLATEQELVGMIALGPAPTIRKAIGGRAPPQAPLPLKTCSLSGNFDTGRHIFSIPFMVYVFSSSNMARISAAMKRRVKSIPPMPITRFFIVTSLRRPNRALFSSAARIPPGWP